RGDEEALPREEVRAGEVDLLRALVGDRVGAEVVVDVAVHDVLLAVRGGDRLVLDLVLAEAERGGDPAGDVDDDAAALTGGGVEIAEAGLVLLAADDHAVALGHRVERGAVLELDVLGDLEQGLVPAVTGVTRAAAGRRGAAAVAGGQGEQ